MYFDIDYKSIGFFMIFPKYLSTELLVFFILKKLNETNKSDTILEKYICDKCQYKVQQTNIDYHIPYIIILMRLINKFEEKDYW